MYKKRLTTALLTLFCGAAMQAQTISMEVAQQRAAAIKGNDVKLTSTSTSMTTTPVLAYTGEKDGMTCFYVFNYPEGGWAIMGGDEKARKVLAYSKEGTFDYATCPDPVKAWLGEYEMQIAHAIKTKADVDPDAASTQSLGLGAETTASTRQEIAHMLKTEWSQNGPYNLAITDEENPYYTGCVITAGAQVLKYLYDRGWNIEGKDSAFAAFQLPQIAGKKAYTAKAVNTKYNYQWNLMPNYYDFNKYSYTNDELYSVADLMYRLGRACGATYEATVTNSCSVRLARALAKCYNFDPSISVQSRCQYTDAEWEQMVYDELAKGLPVIYGGISTKKATDGHVFVIDGYTEQSPFSAETPGFWINWGWDGECQTTAFSLSAVVNNLQPLQPSATDDSYTVKQDMITGLRMNTGGSVIYTMRLEKMTWGATDKEYKETTKTAKAGDTVPLYILYNNDTNEGYRFLNNSIEDVYVYLGMKLVNTATKEVTYQKIHKDWFQLGPYIGAYTTKDINFSITAPTTPGTYTITPVMEPNTLEHDEWSDAITTLGFALTLTVTDPTGVSQIESGERKMEDKAGARKTIKDGRVVITDGDKQYTTAGEILRY